jgi:poly(A) polymerase
MSEIFPGGVRMSEFSSLVCLEGADSDPIRRLAVLLTTPAEKVIEILKLSNWMADYLTFYCEKEIYVSEEPKKIKRLFYEMQKMDLLGLLLVKTALNPKYKKMLNVAHTIAQNWSVPTFPLRGLDLLKLGIKPGIEVGNTLVKVERWWILSEFKYNKKDCLNWVRDHYANGR